MALRRGEALFRRAGFGLVEFGVVVDFAGGGEGADLVDKEVLDSLIAVVLVPDGVLIEDSGDILLLMRKADDINLFILPFQLIGNPLHIFHRVIVLIVNLLQVELHHNIRPFLIPIQLSIHNIVPPACELDPVDVVDDGVDLVELDVQVGAIVDELGLDVDDFHAAELL